MGGSSSKPDQVNTSVNLTSDQMKNLVQNMFGGMPDKHNSATIDTIGFRSESNENVQENYGLRFQSKLNRYDGVLAKIANKNKPVPQEAAVQVQAAPVQAAPVQDAPIQPTMSPKLSEVKSLKNILEEKQQGGDASGGCGCDSNKPMPTNCSPQPIDYANIKGGAEGKKDNSSTSTEDSSSATEDGSSEEDFEDEDGDEGETKMSRIMDDSDGTSETSTASTTAEDSTSTNASSTSSDVKKSTHSAHSVHPKQSRYEETSMSGGNNTGTASEFRAVPFYSSENASDYFKKYQNRSKY
jgi:hypothetical protein